MPDEPTITCSNCGAEIKLTESLAAPLLATVHQQHEQEIAKKDAEIAEKGADITKREAAVKEDETALARAKEEIDEQVAAKLDTERSAIAAEEQKKARRALGNDLEKSRNDVAELNDVIKQRDEKLAEAQKAEVEWRRKQRQLDDDRREMDLTIEKRVQESLDTTRERAKKEAEDALKLKVAEKASTIVAMQKQIEELKRKAEQGSQQLQGDVQELELEAMLHSEFPQDTIERISKGAPGADVLQGVIGPSGQTCGSILWESKRTKNWSDGWLPKLRDDKRVEKAEIAVMVSQSLPKGMDTFKLIDEVCVTSYGCALPVAMLLRQSLIELATARKASEGQETKMELVYRYLTGPDFRHHVEAIVEKFEEMSADLDKERRTMQRQWAKREAQIRGVIKATAGMYGDLQGIAGKTLQEIEGLDMPLLPDGSADGSANDL